MNEKSGTSTIAIPVASPSRGMQSTGSLRLVPTTSAAPAPAALERAHGAGVHAWPGVSRGWAIAKRALDVTFAVLGLIAAIPILVVVAIAIKNHSPGPLLFRQRRFGRDLEPFTVLKFRTMHVGVSAESHHRYIAELANGGDDEPGLKKLVGDKRVTRVGRVLRRLSLDELPQLFNVLSGSMSLIGPRPAIEYELEHYRPEHFERFAVRPGLTGLWQVSGRSRLGFTQMLDLDAEYARSCNARTDLAILARTPRALLHDSAA